MRTDLKFQSATVTLSERWPFCLKMGRSVTHATGNILTDVEVFTTSRSEHKGQRDRQKNGPLRSVIRLPRGTSV